MKRGQFEVFTDDGLPSSVIVFDDGIYVLQGSWSAAFLSGLGSLLLGPFGSAIALSRGRQAVAVKLTSIEALGPDATATEAAVAGAGGRLLEAGAITRASVTQSRSGSSLLTFDHPEGKVKLSWSAKDTPIETVVGLLEPLLRERLTVG